mmetsp:Transcript_12453/g.15452  ORF Transcript_12453/g.15452 Transcript_12453/m.15452 type:complete len:324 (+) Transcript_12453:143-1114(+)
MSSEAESDEDSSEYVSEEPEDENEFDAEVEIKRILRCNTHYAVLSLNPKLDLDLNDDSLRNSYLEKSMLISPSSCSHPFAKKAFAKLVQAYDTLSSPVDRREYDRQIGRRVKRRKNSNGFGTKLNKLADTLSEISKEQDLKPINTPLRTIARGLLWVDRSVSAASRRRVSSTDSEDSDADSDEESADAIDSNINNRREIPPRVRTRVNTRETVEESFRNDSEEQSQRASRLVIEDGSVLRRLAQGFSNMDTVLSSYMALARAGHQAHREQARQLREAREQMREINREDLQTRTRQSGRRLRSKRSNTQDSFAEDTEDDEDHDI